jgi:hypothetical protein
VEASFLKTKQIVNLEITISGPFCLIRNIITIAVFYALPVIQLVITYQTVSAAQLESQLPTCRDSLHCDLQRKV